MKSGHFTGEATARDDWAAGSQGSTLAPVFEQLDHSSMNSHGYPSVSATPRSQLNLLDFTTSTLQGQQDHPYIPHYGHPAFPIGPLGQSLAPAAFAPEHSSQPAWATSSSSESTAALYHSISASTASKVMLESSNNLDIAKPEPLHQLPELTKGAANITEVVMANNENDQDRKTSIGTAKKQKLAPHLHQDPGSDSSVDPSSLLKSDRREYNRRAARKSRDKKRERIIQLEGELQELRRRYDELAEVARTHESQAVFYRNLASSLMAQQAPNQPEAPNRSPN